MLPFFVTIPHSGEKVPDFCQWLKGLPEPLLMRDVDRFVDRLYEPALQKLGVPFFKTEWHRYAADMNRIPDDIDQGSVEGAGAVAGTHSRGFHWVITTKKELLMSSPMSQKTHEDLVKLIYEPFHASIRSHYQKLFASGVKRAFHLDAHSMPSLGTSEHKDPGKFRAEIVISDFQGKSCSEDYMDIVISSYVRAGFKVGYNWPYIGGRVTEVYGVPEKGQEALQVELNRGLYMDEDSKQIKEKESAEISLKIQHALTRIQTGIEKLIKLS